MSTDTTTAAAAATTTTVTTTTANNNNNNNNNKYESTKLTQITLQIILFQLPHSICFIRVQGYAPTSNEKLSMFIQHNYT
jgi:hypothetical protein